MVEDVFEIEKTFFDLKTNQSMIDSFCSDSLNYFVLLTSKFYILEGKNERIIEQSFQIRRKQNNS